MGIVEKVVGDKRRWRAYKARVAALPPGHRQAAEAVERYLMHAGGVADGSIAATMLEDLADLFEQSVAGGTSVRSVVGDDPVAFVEDFVRSYDEGSWLRKERARLVAGVEAAEAASDEGGGRP